MPLKTAERRSILGFEVPPNASLAERVYGELRERIVVLGLAPGSLINEQELMKELGVSRTPIREALLRLALEKLVTVISRRGTFVSEVNVGNVSDIYEFRRELEGIAAAWAAERRTEADLAEIEALIEELNEVERREDIKSQIAADQQAHLLCYRLADNPYLTETLTLHYFLAMRIWFLADKRGAGLHDPQKSLAVVLEAILAQDPGKARKLAEQHAVAAEVAVRSGL